jgi:hypothetical protein
MSAVTTVLTAVVAERVKNAGKDLMEVPMLLPSASTTSIADRVRGEFREMPGLTLTLSQAGRLWSLDPPTCNEVLSQLVQTGYLCRTSSGAFCRATDLPGRVGRLPAA